jgi:FkbM family methyltransferase
MSLSSQYTSVNLVKRHFHVSYFKILLTYLQDRPFNVSIKNHNISIRKSQVFPLAKLLENGWNVISVEQNQLTLKGLNNEIINCRTLNGYDFGHLVEIFLDQAYDLDVLNKNVIDIGMSNGDSSIYFAKQGAKYVIGVEPDKRSFDIAINNIRQSQINNILPLNKALSNIPGKIELIVYDSNPNANSIDVNNMVTLQDSKHKESVESITLNEIIGMFNGENVGLLKMDCEGCEYSVIEALDKLNFEKISNIYMEYHHGLQLLPKILKQNGFVVSIQENSKFMGYIKARKDKQNLP